MEGTSVNSIIQAWVSSQVTVTIQNEVFFTDMGNFSITEGNRNQSQPVSSLLQTVIIAGSLSGAMIVFGFLMMICLIAYKKLKR